jgi:hypothetical protein
MQFAVDASGQKIGPKDHPWGYCPGCGQYVVAKRGEIVCHHFAHEGGVDCDPWAEHETAWHLGWKGFASVNNVEKNVATHRADIVLEDGTVVELQHSGISPEEIREREAVYEKMIWLFDGTDLNSDRLSLRERDYGLSFRWKHPRKSYAACTKLCCIDLGIDRGIFVMRKLHLEGGAPYGGWGELRPHLKFVSWLVKNTGHKYTINEITIEMIKAARNRSA